MSIRIDADQRASSHALPDLETSFEQRLGWRRCRHFLPDSAVQQARSFTQLQGRSVQRVRQLAMGRYVSGLQSGLTQWVAKIVPTSKQWKLDRLRDGEGDFNNGCCMRSSTTSFGMDRQRASPEYQSRGKADCDAGYHKTSRPQKD